MDTTALGFEFEEELELIESAARRKKTELQKQYDKERRFKIRTKAVEEYYLRLSYYKKKEFFVKLLSNVRTAESVSHIMKFMPVGYNKAYYYVAADPTVDFYYEDSAPDHNRMLEDAVVELQMATDIEWFRLLSDVNQVVLIISLLRLGGGYTRRLVSMPLTLEYFRRIRALPPSLPGPSSPNKKVHIKGSEIETDEEDNEENEENCYDPNHPSTIEVEKQRKKWNDITAKYKREVESLEKKISNKNEEEKKKGGLGKKGGKSKTSQKSSKKGKGKKVQDEVDRIQSLPVWIIKKILGYLDQKNLKKLKVVNSYWTYIIQDLIIDIKMRKKLDKTIEKIKSQIDPAKLEEAVTKKVIDEKQTKIKKSRRAKAHYECSVTAKELIPRELIGLTEKSLNVDVHNEIYAEEDYRKEDDKPLLTFPRVIKDDKLYDYVPCPLRDVKVVLGLQDGTERHISFLTYSLSSRQSSIEFDVQAEDLRDW